MACLVLRRSPRSLVCVKKGRRVYSCEPHHSVGYPNNEQPNIPAARLRMSRKPFGWFRCISNVYMYIDISLSLSLSCAATKYQWINGVHEAAPKLSNISQWYLSLFYIGSWLQNDHRVTRARRIVWSVWLEWRSARPWSDDPPGRAWTEGLRWGLSRSRRSRKEIVEVEVAKEVEIILFLFVPFFMVVVSFGFILVWLFFRCEAANAWRGSREWGWRGRRAEGVVWGSWKKRWLSSKVKRPAEAKTTSDNLCSLFNTNVSFWPLGFVPNQFDQGPTWVTRKMDRPLKVNIYLN